MFLSVPKLAHCYWALTSMFTYFCLLMLKLAPNFLKLTTIVIVKIMTGLKKKLLNVLQIVFSGATAEQISCHIQYTHIFYSFHELLKDVPLT